MNEKGRSMVEMLGVLAIIGVLSAGGLAGYSKAMFQHRVNETINVVSLVLQRLVDLTQKDLGDDFKIETAEDIVKYGLLDKCQEATLWGHGACKLPMGVLRIEKDESTGIFIGLSSVKECIAFLSVHWENVLPIEWWVNSGGAEISVEGPGTHQLYYSTLDGAIHNNMTMEKITEACQEECAVDDDCSISLFFNKL